MTEPGEEVPISESDQKPATTGTTAATDVLPREPLQWRDSGDRPGREWTKGLSEGQEGEKSEVSKGPGEESEKATAEEGEVSTTDQTSRK